VKPEDLEELTMSMTIVCQYTNGQCITFISEHLISRSYMIWMVQISTRF